MTQDEIYEEVEAMIPAELWEKVPPSVIWRNGRAGRAGRICGRTPPSGRGLVRGPDA